VKSSRVECIDDAFVGLEFLPHSERMNQVNEAGVFLAVMRMNGRVTKKKSLFCCL